jgi:hypothetical protein
MSVSPVPGAAVSRLAVSSGIRRSIEHLLCHGPHLRCRWDNAARSILRTGTAVSITQLVEVERGLTAQSGPESHDAKLRDG